MRTSPPTPHPDRGAARRRSRRMPEERSPADGHREAVQRPHIASGYLLAVLPLLAVALGGATARWSQGIVLIGLGALLVWRPPPRSAGWAVHVLSSLFLLCGAAALLPATWFGNAATTAGAWWRGALVEDYRVPLPATASPQPWLTAEGLLPLAAGLAWLYLILTYRWASGERRAAARVFVGGAALLAAVAVVARLRGVEVPGWHAEYRFGPFPNRNQTANFFALAALPGLALARREFRAGRWVRAGGWAGAVAVLAQAIFFTYSRAGVAMLFAGVALFALLVVLAPKPSRRESGAALRSWLPRTALAASLALLLLAGFFLFGGKTLERFRPAAGQSVSSAATTAFSGDFRWRIQGDALAMDRTLPVCGLGIGNFGAVFPFFRERSAGVMARAIHPESDWLWLWAEMGWPAVVIAALGLGLLLRRVQPWQALFGVGDSDEKPPGEASTAGGGDRTLRLAAVLGVLAFVCHSFVEVSTHRIATALAATFLLGLALPPVAVKIDAGREVQPSSLRPRWLPAFFRLVGVLLIVAGAGWLVAIRTGAVWPGAVGVENLRLAAAAAATRSDLPAVETLTTRALAIAPLDYRLYYIRGMARIYAAGNETAAEAAADDLRRARALEPFFAELPVREAQAWLQGGGGAHAARAVPAVAEAFRRDPVSGERAFHTVFQAASSAASIPAGPAAAVREGLEALAWAEPRLFFAFLDELGPQDAGPRLAAVFEADPELDRFDAAGRTEFLRLWAERGDDLPALSALLDERPDWQPLAWRAWARALARAGEPERACALAERFAPAPTLPPVLGGGRATASNPAAPARSTEELQRIFGGSRGGLAPGLELLRAQRDAGQRTEMLATLRELTARPAPPAYLFFLEAQLRTEARDWPRAWLAWENYLQRAGTSDAEARGRALPTPAGAGG